MKSELQEFMEKAYAAEIGAEVSLKVTEQIKQEMRIISDLGEKVAAIGIQRFNDIAKRAMKNG